MEPFEFVPVVCRECWAVTANLELHEAWHAQMNERVGAAHQAGYQASIR